MVGILNGDRPGRTIAWRADIDALPLTEVLDAPFASGTQGVMHACGHDGHTAIGITLAEILAARRAELPGTAVFIFQPAEEVLGGASPMIEAGVLEQPRVEEIYGLHLSTQNPVGFAMVRSGPTMASADAFEIEVRGHGGHGAYPHLSVDPVTAAAHILIGMQHLMAKEIAAQETVVLTVGQITAGTKNNIIPATAVMRGTLRTFDEGVRAQILSGWVPSRPTSHAPIEPTPPCTSATCIARPWSTTRRRRPSFTAAQRPNSGPARSAPGAR